MLGDCPDCWEALCTCGRKYREWTPDALKEQIVMLGRVLKDKGGAHLLRGYLVHPDPEDGDCLTETDGTFIKIGDL